jgi:hypothetical protein
MGFLNNPAWREIESQYKSARMELLRLAEETGTIGSTAKNLISNIDSSYSILKHRVEQAIPFERSLTPPLPPPIDRTNLRGILAYRAWEVIIKGSLSPSVQSDKSTWFKEIAFADQIPEAHYDSHGLYAHRLEIWKSNGYGDKVSGLVDLYGKVIEHSDGILRAECARVKMIMLTITDNNQLLMMLASVYESFKLTYPNTPIYIVTPYQKDLIMWREVLITLRLLNGGKFEWITK